jgi:DNA-binding LytR/AlgR family response regulator
MTQTPRCLVAEDEPLLAASLVAELAAVWPELQVQAQVGDGLQAVAQSLALLPDVCFFDIRMPGCTGLEAAQALAEDWPDDAAFPLLVFVTAYDSYALQAFEAQAVDYLVKPVTRPRLLACVTRLKDRLKGRFDAQTAALPQTQPQTADSLQHTMAQLRSLLAANLARPAAAAVGAAGAPGQTEAPVPRLAVVQAQVGNLVHMVPVEEVLYFEAADKYVRVVTAQREHLIRASLKDLLPQLDPQVFWQVHRGTVVQARLVASARREESGKVTLALKGSADKLTASRLYAHLFKGM